MKAVALVSGGLDSTLAVKLVKDLGIEIVALNFKTPFCLCDGKSASGCLSHARQVAVNLGIEFKLINIAEDFLKIIEKPKHGHGSNMNPCIDCRILKFSKAKEYMHQIGGSFIITGEVLGQRPMSQHRKALNIIDKESQLEGLVLRPLSARLMEETVPEKEGWVNRGKLLDFNGRGRKPQIELARKFNIKDYPCPAGGCLLTDPEFSRKIKDLIKHEGLSIDNIELLKVGRQFRLASNVRLVVGRNEKENQRLLTIAQNQDYLFYPGEDLAGPTALGRGNFNEELIRLSCSIVARYCDVNGQKEAGLNFKRIPQESVFTKSVPILDAELAKFRI